MENTSKRDPMLHLLGMMSEGQSGYIEGMEADGQRQLVASQQVPVEGSAGLAEMGFTLGDRVPGDDLFRTATLPEGWKKVPSDHAMWSYIEDQHGRRRVAIFYKAAFYDRKAFCRIETPESYLRAVMYDNGRPVLDDTWLTAEIADAALVEIRDEEIRQAREMRDHANETHRTEDNRAALREYAEEHDAEAAKVERFRLAVTQ